MIDADLNRFLERRRQILARRRRLLKSGVVMVIVLLVAAGAVFAYFKATGTGTASAASVGSLSAPASQPPQ